MGGADERQQVVLADRLQADVAQDDHLLVLLVEAALEQRAGVLAQAAEDLGVHLGDPLRRPPQPFAGRVLADRREQIGHGLRDRRPVHVSHAPSARPC